MTVDQTSHHVGEIGVWLDVVHFAAFDEGGEDRPSFSAFVSAGEERIFAPEGHRGVILPVSSRK